MIDEFLIIRNFKQYIFCIDKHGQMKTGVRKNGVRKINLLTFLVNVTLYQ